MYQLYIANKNYSSWSLRPWVLMKTLDIPFDESLIPFHDQAAWDHYRQTSASGTVPMLEDHHLTPTLRITDSLAITEYLAERHAGVWPKNTVARAFARSSAAEMHSGFSALRSICSMSCGIRVQLRSMNDALNTNLSRLDALWRDGLSRFGGPFLAGSEFSAADAFFCPVAFRIQTYGLKLSPAAMDYANRLLNLPVMQEWYEAALREPFRDEPHEHEIRQYGAIMEDLRLPTGT